MAWVGQKKEEKNLNELCMHCSHAAEGAQQSLRQSWPLQGRCCPPSPGDSGALGGQVSPSPHTGNKGEHQDWSPSELAPIPWVSRPMSCCPWGCDESTKEPGRGDLFDKLLLDSGRKLLLALFCVCVTDVAEGKERQRNEPFAFEADNRLRG